MWSLPLLSYYIMFILSCACRGALSKADGRLWTRQTVDSIPIRGNEIFNIFSYPRSSNEENVALSSAIQYTMPLESGAKRGTVVGFLSLLYYLTSFKNRHTAIYIIKIISCNCNVCLCNVTRTRPLLTDFCERTRLLIQLFFFYVCYLRTFDSVNRLWWFFFFESWCFTCDPFLIWSIYRNVIREKITYVLN